MGVFFSCGRSCQQMMQDGSIDNFGSLRALPEALPMVPWYNSFEWNGWKWARKAPWNYLFYWEWNPPATRWCPPKKSFGHVFSIHDPICVALIVHPRSMGGGFLTTMGPSMGFRRFFFPLEKSPVFVGDQTLGALVAKVWKVETIGVYRIARWPFGVL